MGNGMELDEAGLPYEIKPWQLTDRKLRLRTDLDLQHVETDWTNGKQLFMNPISTRVIQGPAGETIFPVGNPMLYRLHR